ncbi:hypothetical protein Tco_0008816 [Tanacetum coccineum]
MYQKRNHLKEEERKEEREEENRRRKKEESEIKRKKKKKKKYILERIKEDKKNKNEKETKNLKKIKIRHFKCLRLELNTEFDNLRESYLFQQLLRERSNFLLQQKEEQKREEHAHLQRAPIGAFML